ncbi:MAG: NAD+ synthase [Candidatus Lokiarchaeota archaeon]
MTVKNLKIVIGQINPIVGYIDYNFKKIKDVILHNQNADLVIFPEMVLCGYPLQDHILDPLIQEENKYYINKVKELETQSAIIFGTFTQPEELKQKIQRFHNSAIVIKNNKIIHLENKKLLPTYDIFDERRYFSYDDKFNPVQIKDTKIGILICEDIWDDVRHYETNVAKKHVENGAELLIVINASPYHIGKFQIRKDMVSKKSRELEVPIIYVNMVGGLDEIVFDGRTFITDHRGKIVYKGRAFQEDVCKVTLEFDNEKFVNIISEKEMFIDLDWREEVLEALKLNLYDYYHKSGIFDGIVLGLSGGIDSAFTAYICAQSIGPKNVNCIMMPTKYTSQESLDLSKSLCHNLGVNYIIHPIDSIFQSYENSLQDVLGELQFDVADENLQARIRATILMYYSNKYNWLLVSTGNKSEIGVGYCTLYGDTSGGKNVPGDLLKVQIYDICNWINQTKEIIPEGIIERPPTAELRENQKDSDSLPPYETLDQILKELIQNGIGSEYRNLKEKGFDKETINKVRKLYLNSEYKRRQLVQTIRVSESAFGIGRRYPVLKRIDLTKEFE